MKILGIEIGEPWQDVRGTKPKPPLGEIRLLDSPVSPIVETAPKTETDPRVFQMLEKYEGILDRALSLSEKWEQHLAQSQAEKYEYVRRLDAAIAERNGVSDRLVQALKKLEALKAEPKLPRMVSHKPAVQS